MTPTRAWRTGCALAACAVLAACGGGGGGGAETPESVTAGADTATALRGQPLNVDVLANDRASRGGTLTLAAITTAPAHGQAVIEGNRIRYTPNQDHLGGDRLSYVVRVAGGGEAVGELSISTEATVALRGTVTDSPIANAAVTVTVGNRSYSATANAQGQYEVNVTMRQPGEMLRLEATGTGAQSQVRLSSLVGDAAGVVAAAGTGTTVSEGERGALRVTHVSTAQEALVLEGNNGSLPATQAVLEAVQSRLDPVTLINLAAAVRLVVDGGISLPTAAADTLALVRNPVLRAAFAETHAAALVQMATQVASDPSLGLAAVSPLAPGATTVTRYYFFGRGGIGQTAYRVTYRLDGSASVSGAGMPGSKTARWAINEGELRISFETPWERQFTNFPFDPATGQQQLAINVVRIHALHIRPMAGNRESAIVQFSTTGSQLRDGAVLVAENRSAAAVYQQRTEAALDTPLTATDFPAGSRWGGLGFYPAADYSNRPEVYGGMHDLVELAAGGRFRQTITGLQGTWQVADGALELRADSGERLRYRRLQRVDAFEERWLLERLTAEGSPLELTERLVVRQDPALTFNASTVTGLWLSQVNLLMSEANQRFYVKLAGDGAYSTVLSNFNTGTGLWDISEQTPGTWSVLEDRSLRSEVTPRSPSQTSLRNVRDWIPLARQGNKLLVLEWRAIVPGPDVDRARVDAISGWRTNIYTLEPRAY